MRHAIRDALLERIAAVPEKRCSIEPCWLGASLPVPAAVWRTNMPNGPILLDSFRGSSVKIGTIQRKLAWPLRKDDTLKSGSVLIFCKTTRPILQHCRNDAIGGLAKRCGESHPAAAGKIAAPRSIPIAKAAPGAPKALLHPSPKPLHRRAPGSTGKA